jgi:hypothetical protein
LKETFFQVVDTLNQHPVRLPVNDPMTGASYQIIVDGSLLIGAVVDVFSINVLDQVAEIPLTITQAADPRIAAFYNRRYELDHQVCKGAWGEYFGAPRPETISPKGDIPVLIINTDQDYRTAGDWSEDTTSQMPNATIVNMVNSGSRDLTWMGMKSTCITTIMANFLIDPSTSSDIACVSEKSLSRGLPSPCRKKQ